MGALIRLYNSPLFLLSLPALVPFHTPSPIASFLSALAFRPLPTIHSFSSSDSKPTFEARGRVELAELRVVPTSVTVRHDARYVQRPLHFMRALIELGESRFLINNSYRAFHLRGSAYGRLILCAFAAVSPVSLSSLTLNTS